VRAIADWRLRIADWTHVLRIRNPQSAIRIVLIGALTGCTGGNPSGEQVTVTIPRGATFEAAVESLTARGVVTNPVWFRVYARLRGLPAALKSGIYALQRDDAWSDVVTALKSGRGIEVRFTVPEAIMAAEIAALAHARLGVPRDSFLAAVRDTALARELGIGPNAPSVEGYLYPTTYFVPAGIRARDLVQVMTREFLAHWPAEWDARLDALRMTRHEIVTLASIIEAEVRYRPDRPYVSAVYHNRLRRGMALQADPTVIYAHGRRLRRVWEKHLRVRSPYNTYLHPGLPPGPIGQPSDSSILAALEPPVLAFLYFVAQPDGKHIFSNTYAEHLAAIRRVKELQRAARVPPQRRSSRIARRSQE
jgi:peptidoglycan lytic transglycosylase G